jgi:serine protease
MDSNFLRKSLFLVFLPVLLLLSLSSCGGNDSSSSSTPVVPTYTVGGTVSGLSGTLVLRNNDWNPLTVTADGSFTFSAALRNGVAYSVTVSSKPMGQTCTIANGSGTISSANVTNVQVSCTDNIYTVGGTVSDLSGTLVLRNNGQDDLTVTADGPFTFSTKLGDGDAYNVTVSSQPSGRTCTITNGTGTISSASVADVQVACTINVALSGEIAVPQGVLIDSDVNDVNESYTSNDDPYSPQILPNPISVGGYVNRALTGGSGRSYYSGDPDDYFQVPLKTGDTVALAIGKTNTLINDLDLFLYDATGSLVDYSAGTGSYEFVTPPSDGDYIVDVYAYRGASNYVLTIGTNTPAGAEAETDPGILSIRNDFVPGQVIIRFKETDQTISSGLTPMAAVTAMGMKMSAGSPDREVLMTFDSLDSQDEVLQAQGITKRLAGQKSVDDSEKASRMNTIEVIKALRKRDDILSAEPNYILHHYSTEPDDTYYGLQWHYPLINLPEAWDYTTGDNNVIVAVIDTGVLMEHPDLSSRLTDTGYDFILSTSRSNDGDGIDPDPEDPGDGILGSSSFHGTHCAGTVAAETNNATGMAGVTWSTQIMPVRVLGVGGGTSYDIQQGIRYAAGMSNDSGTVPPQSADILSMSLGGGGYSAATQTLIDDVRALGIVVIASAGNENASIFNYPASYDGVISVSAVNINGTKASYSNYGTKIDVAAPGGDSGDLDGDGYPDVVWSTCGDDSSGTIVYGYSGKAGTSMATPHVAGVVALMKALYPALSPDELDFLISTGDVADDIGVAGRDDFYGYGLIDALKAVVAAQEASGGGGITGFSVDPNVVNFGTSGTSVSAVVSKFGTGALSITDITDNADWLTVTGTSVDGDGFGTYTLEADRSGFTQDGTYKAAIDFTASSGESISVTVTIQVSTGSVTYYAGYHYVLLVRVNDDNTFDIVDQFGVGASGDYYSYTLTDVPQGVYRIFAGSDRDNDGNIDNAGESMGAYPTLDQVTDVNATGNLSGLDFQTDLRLSISAPITSTNSEAVSNGLRRLK